MGNKPVSDLHLLDMTPDQLNDMIDNLTPEPALSREQEAELLARLPSAPAPAGRWYFGWNIPAWPKGVWVFNPFAWQLLFVFGAWCGLGGAQKLARWVNAPA